MNKTTSPSPVSSSARAPYCLFASASMRSTQNITQTYSLAHMARRKLAREASRSDLHLGRLVGHANLLDSLMLELGRAEREQQQWIHAQTNKFRQSEGPRHIQWADCVVVEEEAGDDWHTSDADSDVESEYDVDDKFEMGEEEEEEDVEADMEADMVSLQRVSSYRILPTATTLTRTSLLNRTAKMEDVEILQLEYSPSNSSPPELDHDSDSSEDEAMPPSPPADKVSLFLPENSPTILYPSRHHHLSNGPASPETPAFFNKSFYHPQTKNDHHMSVDIY